jgi:hypothetical protein
MEGIVKGLQAIVGEEGGVRYDWESSFRTKPRSSPLIQICPSKIEEISGIVKYAEENGLKIFTAYSTFFPSDVDYKNGIILSFSRFKGLERIEPDSLVAWVKRGSSFEEIKSELKKYKGLKLLVPLVSSSDSVVENYASRALLKASNRYPELPFATLHLVLSGGRIMKTGEHALSEDMGDNRDDPGPNLSRWFFGSDDYLGIVYLSCIFLFPEGERGCLVFKTKIEELGGIYKEVCRKELVQEAIGGEGKVFRKLTKIDFEDGFYVIFGFEGPPDLVKYQMNKVLSLMKGVERVEDYEKRMMEELDRNWIADGIVSYGYLPLSKLTDFYNEAKEFAENIIFSSYSRGGCAGFCAWNSEDWTRGLVLKLKKEYSMVERYLPLSGGNNGYIKLLKKIKEMMDPEKIFNPTIYEGLKDVES